MARQRSRTTLCPECEKSYSSLERNPTMRKHDTAPLKEVPEPVRVKKTKQDVQAEKLFAALERRAAAKGTT